jgi:hypothetical protein
VLILPRRPMETPPTIIPTKPVLLHETADVCPTSLSGDYTGQPHPRFTICRAPLRTPDPPTSGHHCLTLLQIGLRGRFKSHT